MKPDAVRHIFHLVVNGGERHRFAIDDMTRWTQNPYQPDLIIRTEDRFHTGGAHRKNAIVTYWVEIVDSLLAAEIAAAKGYQISDPPREFIRAPAEILRIDIAKCKTLEEIVSLIKERIP